MKNFAWIATWKITRRCNLYCVYCDHASMLPAAHKENIDYVKVIGNIEKYSPKILNISGGEPTLVENLPDILKDIKSRWNPFIRVVHNGTNPKKLLPCLPFLDKIVISMDGPDPVNKSNRGISADSILNKLKEILPLISEHNVGLFLNCVLTVNNLPYMKELAIKAKELSPEITVSYTPLMPPQSDLSILTDKKSLNEFENTYDDLKQNGYRVMQVFDAIRRHDDFRRIKCYNQFFNIRIMPDGNVFTCAMNTELDYSHYKYYLKKLFSEHGLKKALIRIRKKTQNDLFHNIDFSCNTICSCEGWLDLVFLGIKSDCILSYARGLAGRLNENDYKTAEDFVKKYINPDFNIDYLKSITQAPEINGTDKNN
jgi:MoaA/NifB/PqqE/SkfB family radical SAM enzyme